MVSLAATLAKSQGINWENLEDFHHDRDKYVQEALDSLGVSLYDVRHIYCIALRRTEPLGRVD